MSRKQPLWICWTIAAIAVASCSQTALQGQEKPVAPKASLRAVTVDPAKVVMGQTLYVPVYSHVYQFSGQDHVMNLSVTLSIRNTDLTNSIIITAVRYYDTDGQLIRQDIKSPVELKPLASTDFFMAADDSSGGTGANFIVEWVAEKPVYEPVVEALMINTMGNQGLSFVIPAKVLKRQGMQN
jgi:Protein of unknown function (DUF3124)